MRFLFKKGKQRELIKKEKEILGLTWIKFADILGIKYRKLMTFFMEERLIDEITFCQFSLSKKYKKFIIEEKLDNWGQSKGGFLSKGTTKDINIPEKNELLAEFWGIMLGDGHLQKIRKYKVGTYGIDVAGHSLDDKDYLINFVKPLCETLFRVKSRIYKSKRSKCMHLNIDSKKIVDFFEREGFRSGNKIVNQVTIPNWIKQNDLFLCACLRGLYDTDGSFYRLTNQNSYQVHFKNLNKTLLNDVRESLLNLGINVSKIICDKSIVVTKKSEIEKFYKLVGFHNPKHLNKIRKLF